MPESASAPPTEAGTTRGFGWLVFGENLLLALTLAALMVLPLAEIVLRSFFRTGISGSAAFVQHFTLIVGMLGGAVAARDNRLLALSTLTALLRGRWKAAALIFSTAFAVAVSVLLCRASWAFLLTEKLGGKTLAYGIPIWIVQLILPIGFGLVALCLVWHSGQTWKGRLSTLLLAAAWVAIGQFAPWDPARLVLPGLIGLGLAAILGAPIFSIIGGATLILLWGIQSPLAMIPLQHYSLVTNPALPSIPLFTLAGYFLAEGGASKRLVRVFQALVGWFRGGSVIVTVLVCAFFTSFTGASGVTILALGGLLMPVLLAAGQSERNALGLLTGAGSLGVLFPPCLPLILYAIIAGTTVANLGVDQTEAGGVSIEQMFLGGIGPGFLMLVLTAGLGIWQGRRSTVLAARFDVREAASAVWAAKWELLLPVVALVSLFSGVATPVEAAAVTAGYAFVIESLFYRDLRIFRDAPRVMTECGLLIGGVLLILGVAKGFTSYLDLEQVPAAAVDWVRHSIESPLVFLLALNVILLLVGCIMDIYSAIVVVVPLIVPMGLAFGIDPIHLGIVFLANLQVGYLTPPVGMNLFLSAYRFNRPILEVTRAAVPLFLMLLLAVLIITYVPALSTFLPRGLKG